MGIRNRIKNILIVEDDQDMQELYRDFFAERKSDYRIDIEEKANAGLKRITEKPYDLVILDIIMEPIPGDTFYVCTRSYQKTKNIPILIVSVLSPETLANLKRINHVSFLQKPITEEQLFAKVEEILN